MKRRFEEPVEKVTDVGDDKVIVQASAGKHGRNTRNDLETESLHIINLNVGQGAGALFIVTQETSNPRASVIKYVFLMDGGFGYNKTQVRTILGTHRIDAACVTHSDADHANAPIELADIIDKYYLPYTAFREVGSRGNVPVQGSTESLWTGDSGARLTINWRHVYSGGTLMDGENSKSLAATVHWGKFTYYFDGDLDQQRQATIMDAVGQVDCLYITHHGSQKTSFPDFLARLRPRVAILSSGINPHGHPDEEFMQRVNQLEVKPDVLLTNCHYNRPEANPAYWTKEYDNFVAWHAADTLGRTPVDIFKRAREFLQSLELAIAAAIKLRTGAQDYDALIHAQRRLMTGRLTAKGEKSESKRATNTYALVTEAFFRNLKLLFDAAGVEAGGVVPMRVAGAVDSQGAIVIAMTGEDPSCFDVFWRNDGTRKRYLIADGKNAAVDNWARHQATYLRSYGARTVPMFATSNRFKRAAAKKLLYKCLGCGNNIKVPGTEVLVLCDARVCAAAGPRAYCALCLIRSWERKRTGYDWKLSNKDEKRVLSKKLKKELIAYSVKVKAAQDDPEHEATTEALVLGIERDACPACHAAD